MRRSFLLLILFVLLIFKGASQNLVLNPSFDQFITCPSFGQFGPAWVNDWQKPTIGSTDYYNYNCPGIHPSKQAPHSGEGYAGIICYNFGTEYREYITGELSSPLQAGVTYEVEFHVSLNDGYIQAIKEVDAYLSINAPGPFSNALHIGVTPQITNQSGALDDTSAWMKVSGNYIASGGEQFITIGNFRDDNNTTISQPGSIGSFGAYYFVDDVSVTPINTTSISTSELNSLVDILNTTDGHINIRLDIRFPLGTGLKIQCYDMYGKRQMTLPIETRNEYIDMSPYQKGIYIIEITDERGIRVLKKVFI
jgi:hypothetical protein